MLAARLNDVPYWQVVIVVFFAVLFWMAIHRWIDSWGPVTTRSEVFYAIALLAYVLAFSLTVRWMAGH
ncbi:MAG: hypothetical protein WD904_14340 [Dehalococcoidia bacterium]